MTSSLLNKLTVIRRESTGKLLREALWRTQRGWKQARFSSQLADAHCEVEYSPVGYYRPALHLISEATRSTILRFADSVCRGEFPWLGYGPVNLGLMPRWNFDFVSGKDWPTVPAAAITAVRHDGSDVKVPWELARMQFLPVLGKAWLLTQEERYRAAARDLLANWIENNSVGKGINWTIAMEAALRSMSICFLLELLTPFSEGEAKWLRRVTASLREHLLFIEAHNEFSHFTRSNHYLSNIVGLLCLSTFLSGSGMEERRRLYRNLVEQEILHQVYEDGGDFEASTGYHLLVTQMFTSTWLLLRTQGLEPQGEFPDRLKKMFRLLSALADERGYIPQIGDCDDGRVELLGDDVHEMLVSETRQRCSLPVLSLLGIGETITGERYRGRTEEAAWYGLLGNSSSSEAEPSAPVAALRTMVFVNSGIAIAKANDAKVIFAAMPNGIGGRGSHTHNDKLSLILRIGGVEVLADCGTGCYTRTAELRNHFRSTAAHNTVLIDDQEQNRFSSAPDHLFLMEDDARVSPIVLEKSEGVKVLTASHDGYRRRNIIHKRKLKLTGQRWLCIEDCLTGSGEHRLKAVFHVPRQWKVSLLQELGREVACRLHGPCTVELRAAAPMTLQMACSVGKISRAYGAVDESSTITLVGTFRAPLTMVSRISWEA